MYAQYYMRTVTLLRTRTGYTGTEGQLSAENFSCFTLELPWRNNASGISCIPEGTYLVKTRKSPRFGITYWVSNVPDREFVLFHAGNHAGDKSKRLRSDVEGCILLGKFFGEILGQRGIGLSGATVRRFMEYMKGEEFELIVRWADGVVY